MENGHYVEGSLWYYAPNKVAPVIWTVLFTISGFLHFWQCMKYKCWRIAWILPWAAILFTVGYALREYGAFHYDRLPIFISSLVFIYAAPPLYELANYCILSRILYYVPHHSPIHPGRVVTTFTAISAIVEALTANGASRVANSGLSKSAQDVGRALLKSALILQLVILACFVSLAVYFHRKCKRAGQLPRNLRAALLTLYISSALIGVRTIYRTVEYFSTADINFAAVDPNRVTPILRYEWFFWVFEATLMLINSFMLNARHPMRFLPRNNKIFLAEDGVTEIEGEGYEDTRPKLLTFLDPFDIGGLVKKKRGSEVKHVRLESLGRKEADTILGAGGSGTAVRQEDV